MSSDAHTPASTKHESRGLLEAEAAPSVNQQTSGSTDAVAQSPALPRPDVPTPPITESPAPLAATSSEEVLAAPPSKTVTPPEPVVTPSSSSTLSPVYAGNDTPSLVQPIPTKPRSNSQLHSSRPAPPSPAPSRPGSQIFSPTLVPSNSSSPAPSLPRDRAGSTSSSRGGRRVSSSSHPSRPSSKPRPKSALGASSFLPDSDSSSAATTPTVESSLVETTIPEHAPASDQTVSAKSQSPVPTSGTAPKSSSPKRDQVIIRDYAFASTDARFAGPGLPLSLPDGRSSRRSSRWGWGLTGPGDSPNAASSSSSARKGSWGSGFGLLSWKSFMSRRRDSDDPQGTQSRSDDDEDDDDYPVNDRPDHDEDDYAFSESDAESGIEEREDGEPWGFYRAVFAFEAIGEHEIGLVEDDIVEVRGRGGGDGWVVAVKRRLDTQGRVVRLDECTAQEAREGLVPESYLEKAGELEIAASKDASSALPADSKAVDSKGEEGKTRSESKLETIAEQTPPAKE